MKKMFLVVSLSLVSLAGVKKHIYMNILILSGSPRKSGNTEQQFGAFVNPHLASLFRRYCWQRTPSLTSSLCMEKW